MTKILRQGGITHDYRPQKNHQVALFHTCRVVTEQPTQHRYIAQTRDLVTGLDQLVVNQTAEHDQFVVIDHDVGLERARVGNQVSCAGYALSNLRDFLFNFQAHRIAFVDLRLDLQLDTHIFTLNGVKGLPGCLYRTPDNKGYVLTNDDFGLFVVQRHQTGRGQNVAGAVAL